MTERDLWEEIERLCADEGFSSKQKECLRILAKEFATNPQRQSLSEDYIAALFYGNTTETNRMNARKALGRLRDRLAEHYTSTPQATVFVDIPRGSYRMEWSHTRPAKYTIRSSPKHRNPVVGDFWERIIGPQRPSHTYIVFPTEQPSIASDRRLFTGVGEVLSAYTLAQTLSPFNLNEDVCPSHKFDESLLRRDNRLFVFLGSSLANKALRKLRYNGAWVDKQRYIFVRTDDAGHHILADEDERTDWRGGIYDTDAKRIYFYESRPTRRTEYDYGLIAVSRVGSRCIVALEGISTIATYVAAERMLSSDGVEEVQRAAGLPPKDTIPSFELLIRVELLSTDLTIENVTFPASK